MGTQTINSRESASNGFSEAHSPAGTWSTDRGWNMPQNGWLDRVWVYCGGYTAGCNFTFLVYATSNNTITARTSAVFYGAGYGWNSGTFNLNSSNNYGGGSSGYNSPNLYLWSGYGMSFGVYTDGGSNCGFKNDGSSHWWGSGGPLNRESGTKNQFTTGGLFCYAEYFPSCTISSVDAGPFAVGQNFNIYGQSFSSGVQSIVINGSAGAVNVTSWSVGSDGQITATMPSGATSGTVTVNTNAGAATSSGSTGTVTVSGGYVARSGAFTSSQGLFVGRSGAWTTAQGSYVARSGTWNPSQ